MRHHPSRPVIIRRASAAAGRSVRARSAAQALAVVAGVLLLLAVTAPLTDAVRSGVIAVGVVVGLMALAAWSRSTSVAGLSAHGAIPVSLLAVPAPVVEPEMSAAAVLARVPELRDHDHCLVDTAEGWRVVSTEALVSVALSTDGQIGVTAMSRAARWIDADHPVDQLPRVPDADEIWLVEGRRPPLVLGHHHVLAQPIGLRSAREVVVGDDLPSTDGEPESASRPVAAGDGQRSGATTPSRGVSA